LVRFCLEEKNPRNGSARKMKRKEKIPSEQSRDERAKEKKTAAGSRILTTLCPVQKEKKCNAGEGEGKVGKGRGGEIVQTIGKLAEEGGGGQLKGSARSGSPRYLKSPGQIRKRPVQGQQEISEGASWLQTQ